ncbi:hypothetical protein QTP88_006916 [Uroleucon formosanum]
MASAPYLDELRNSLNNLPEELHRNFGLMQELDLKSQKLMNNIDEMTDNYMSNVKQYSVDKKKETMASIKRQFDTAKAYSDDKVQLSIQTYELVDKHIQKLDTELLKFKEKIQLQIDMRDAAIKSKLNLPLKKEGSKLTSAPPSDSVVSDTLNPTKSVDNVAVETSCLFRALVGTGTAYVDMPLDPTEPTFCLCKQVSFGEMIACDNPDGENGVMNLILGDLDILAANLWVCSLHRTSREGIPAIFKMLLMGLERKAPMESRIPELWIVSSVLSLVCLADEKIGAP